mmetsp:Transcript_6319/g.7853  ORF Transcript_6319/g.7853 Transcript_6319/m.7853 type:complete len:234 (+) Transcript_6319:35-736(+)
MFLKYTQKIMLPLVVLLLNIREINGFTGTGSVTTYESYAKCCPSNPNYDENADKSECDDYSACDYPGEFAAFDNPVSYEYVTTHNLVAFFDKNDPNGDKFLENYGNKTIILTKNGITFNATIVDTCADSDCNGCCSKNAKPSGYLVDIEYNTVINNLGDINAADGQISFNILDTQPLDELKKFPLWAKIVLITVAGFVTIMVCITFVRCIMNRKANKEANDYNTMDDNNIERM